MAIGALVATDGRLLSAKLMGLIVEIRVEQFLDEPTRFAIRFADDWCDAPLVQGDDSLRIGRNLTVAVEAGGRLVCLVDGPIEDDSSLMTVAGPGSWHQIAGRDRRGELDRKEIEAVYEGRASDVATSILQAYGFNDVLTEPTPQVFSKKDKTLNQSATDLAFVTQLAKEHGYSFWLDATVRVAQERLTVDRTRAHFRMSPPAGTAPPGLTVPTAARRPVELIVNRDRSRRCVNLTQFQVDRDAKRAARFGAVAMDAADGKVAPVEGTNPQPPIEPKAVPLENVGGAVSRKLKVVTAGGTDEANKKLTAALVEEQWFVKATFSTTVHMLHDVLAPHELVTVVNSGPALPGASARKAPLHDGLYQVRAVTHVINAADHFMDAELRRNATMEVNR